MEKLLPTESSATDESRSSTESNLLATVSVVVPVGPGDSSWRNLLADLCNLPVGAETIVVATVDEPEDFAALAERCQLQCSLRWIKTHAGRGHQLNTGIEAAERNFIWMLHADTRVPTSAFAALDDALSAEVDALYYFDLEFQQDGPSRTRWNTWGVRFRSRYLGLPFGDQGYCLRRETLARLGGFDEQAAYGEDHLLVWAARRSGVPLRRVDATITTSARKYAKAGWASTTLTHLWRTARQALPEWWKWVRG